MERIRGIFSDTTSEYVAPAEPNVGDIVSISIRIPHKLAKEVLLVTDNEQISLKRGKRRGCFDYYAMHHTMTSEPFSYYFQVTTEDGVYYYDARGTVEAPESRFNFRIIPGFHTPDWAKGAVYYQIYVDRFCNGDKSNDVVSGEYRYIDRLVTRSEWDEPVCIDGIGQFYGGDIQGIRDKMGYLKELGVEVIYLNPIFLSPSNHKYDTQDYEYVDPHFGVIKYDKDEVLGEKAKSNTTAYRYIERVTNIANLDESNKLFATMVREAHEAGIKVILDGVFNHCGSFHKWMDVERIYNRLPGIPKGAFITKDSPYKDYFVFERDKWPNNRSYKSWWDFNTLPKLNYANKELYDYICRIGAKWVSEPYNCDGWRLDVAADLGDNSEMNHSFWSDFSKSVKTANPEAVIIAEHYGDASSWLNGREWDSVMNYDAFMEPVTWFTTGMDKHSREYREDYVGNTKQFWDISNTANALLNTPARLTAMNELSNHDHSRFLTRTTHIVDEGRTKCDRTKSLQGAEISVMRQAVAMQMTWQGAPAVYYGDEAGLGGFTDPDNRRPYPWGQEDKDLIEYHKAVIGIHKEYECLRRGSLIPLPTCNGAVAYARKYNKEAVVVAVNTYPVSIELKLPTWMIGLRSGSRSRVLITTDSNGWNTTKRSYREQKGITTVTVGPKGAILLQMGRS